ncbi:MAG: FG-GAP repeat domain-containing protein [Solirubrobacterales bacterium]
MTMIAVAALALFAVPANAKTFSAQQGSVSATITYTKTATTHLTISRNGATLFDGVPSLQECSDACAPSGFTDDPPLRVLDLDGNGEPEVVYSAYSGGAHCCSIAQVYRLNAAANGYDTSEHDFGDPGFALKDLDGDGRPEWMTGDDAFAYRFTAYAFSALPVQVLRFGADGFSDVTNSFPGTINSDLDRWWKRYRRVRGHRDGTELGPVSAWAADMYRLGKRAHVLKVLRSEARHGRLRGPGHTQGARYVKVLDKFLRKSGY